MALEQGREVFAVPGPAMSEVSRGCHRLIQQGAGLVVSAQDVFDQMPELKIPGHGGDLPLRRHRRMPSRAVGTGAT